MSFTGRVACVNLTSSKWQNNELSDKKREQRTLRLVRRPSMKHTVQQNIKTHKRIFSNTEFTVPQSTYTARRVICGGAQTLSSVLKAL